jgi:hypothetical protein
MGCIFRFSCFLIAICAFGLSAVAGPAEDETFAAFEWFCLAHLNKPNGVPELFKPLGISPLPDNRSGPFLAGHPGTAWLVPGTNTNFVVSQTNAGTCGISNPAVDATELKRIFETSLRKRLLGTDRSGSETTDAYAVTYPDKSGGPDVHAVVSFASSALASVKSVNLVALPEQLAAEEGLKIANWP